MPVASHHKVADPAVDTLDKRDVSPGMSRLEDMQNALNGCGFCARMRNPMAFSVRRRAIVLAFLGSLTCKIEKRKTQIVMHIIYECQFLRFTKI